MRTAGRASAMTVISGLPWWRVLRQVTWHWPLANYLRRRNHPTATTRDLTALSFIHFAHWALFKPPNRRRWRRPFRYLLFESNFNGGEGEYIEAFSLVIPDAMRVIWGGAHGVPPPNPVGPFLRYIEENELPVSHYYCAYPDASTRMVRAAIELKKRCDRFEEDVADVAPEQFATSYRAFLTDVQNLM